MHGEEEEPDPRWPSRQQLPLLHGPIPHCPHFTEEETEVRRLGEGRRPAGS